MGEHFIHRSRTTGADKLLFLARRSRSRLRLCENCIDVVHVITKKRVLAIARTRKLHAKVSTNPRWIAPKYYDTIGKQYGFFDIVRHYENCTGGNFFLVP